LVLLVFQLLPLPFVLMFHALLVLVAFGERSHQLAAIK
jgi:hypothetical protein